MSHICFRHFDKKSYKKGKNSKRYSLAMNMKPVPTILDPKTVINKNPETHNVSSPISIPDSPRKYLYQEDQYESFISKDSVKDFTGLNESFSQWLYFYKE